MGKEIIYDKSSEEYKAIKLLESKTTNYSDDGLILHYNIILYNLIINLMKENKKQKEIIDKIKKLIKQYGKHDGQKCTKGFQMWAADFNKLLQILEDKEV